MKTAALFLLLLWVAFGERGPVFTAAAVGVKQNARTLETLSDYMAQFQPVTPIPNTGTPGVLVYPELSGLIASFIGPKAATARQQNTTASAMLALLDAYAAQTAKYKLLYPLAHVITALQLAMTDPLWRAFTTTFSAIARANFAYVIAGTLAPEAIKISTSKEDIEMFGDGASPEVYLPVGGKIYNKAFIFDPSGHIVHEVAKTHLTAEEISELHFTSSPVANNTVFGSPLGRICIAICLDGFTDVVAHLDSLGCSLLAMPSFNTGMWATTVPVNKAQVWQPLDWLNGPVASVSAPYRNITYNINSMMVGNLFEAPADGQSAIVARGSQEITSSNFYIGLGSTNYTANVLAVSPWVMSASSSLTLPQQQAAYTARAQAMAPGSHSPFENGYIATAVFANISLPA